MERLALARKRPLLFQSNLSLGRLTQGRNKYHGQPLLSIHVEMWAVGEMACRATEYWSGCKKEREEKSS